MPEQHFVAWLFSNSGDKILFLLKFNEASISEWNMTIFINYHMSNTLAENLKIIVKPSKKNTADRLFLSVTAFLKHLAGKSGIWDTRVLLTCVDGSTDIKKIQIKAKSHNNRPFPC